MDGASETERSSFFSSDMVSKKSPDLLLKAFADWRVRTTNGSDAVLVLAGPKERAAWCPRLRKMIGQFGLDHRVLLTGPLYDDGWQAYRDADVFVLPSQNENFGNTARKQPRANASYCNEPMRNRHVRGAGGTCSPSRSR